MKRRTKILSDFFRSYEPYGHKVGEVQQVLVTDVSHDRNYYVGHNEFYEQVLVPKEERYMGKMVTVNITKASKFSMVGHPVTEPRMAGLTSPLKRGEVSGLSVRVAKPSVPIPILVLFVAVLMRLFWIFLL